MFSEGDAVRHALVHSDVYGYAPFFTYAHEIGGGSGGGSAGQPSTTQKRGVQVRNLRSGVVLGLRPAGCTVDEKTAYRV